MKVFESFVRLGLGQLSEEQSSCVKRHPSRDAARGVPHRQGALVGGERLPEVIRRAREILERVAAVVTRRRPRLQVRVRASGVQRFFEQRERAFEAFSGAARAEEHREVVQKPRLFPFRRKNQRFPNVPEVVRERTGGLFRLFLPLNVVPQVLLQDVPVAKRAARVVREEPTEDRDEIGGRREIHAPPAACAVPAVHVPRLRPEARRFLR